MSYNHQLFQELAAQFDISSDIIPLDVDARIAELQSKGGSLSKSELIELDILIEFENPIAAFLIDKQIAFGLSDEEKKYLVEVGAFKISYKSEYR